MNLDQKLQVQACQSIKDGCLCILLSINGLSRLARFRGFQFDRIDFFFDFFFSRSQKPGVLPDSAEIEAHCDARPQ